MTQPQRLEWKEEVYWTEALGSEARFVVTPTPVGSRVVKFLSGRVDLWRVSIDESNGTSSDIARAGSQWWHAEAGQVVLEASARLSEADQALDTRMLSVGYLTTGGLHLIPALGLILQEVQVSGKEWRMKASSDAWNCLYEGALGPSVDIRRLVYEQHNAPATRLHIVFLDWRKWECGWAPKVVESHTNTQELYMRRTLLEWVSIAEEVVRQSAEVPDLRKVDPIGREWRAILDDRGGDLKVMEKRQGQDTVVEWSSDKIAQHSNGTLFVRLAGWILGCLALATGFRLRRRRRKVVSEELGS